MKFTNRLSFNRCAAVKYIIIYLNGTKSGDIRRRLINIPILFCISCWYRQITLQIVYIASLSDVTLFLYGLVELYIYIYMVGPVNHNGYANHKCTFRLLNIRLYYFLSFTFVLCLKPFSFTPKLIESTL